MPSLITGTLFSDEFSAALNSAAWDYNHWYPDYRNGSFYGRTQQRQELPSVSDGYLHLVLDTYNPTNGETPSFFGSEAITTQTFSLDPSGGVSFEIVAHFDHPARGIVGGMFGYALHADGNHDEIDFEALSNLSDQIQSNVYENEPFGAGSPQFHVLDDPVQVDHVYRMEWYYDAVAWFVDDELMRVETSVVPQNPMELHLNIWAPGVEWVEAYDATLAPVIDPDLNTSYSFDVDSVEVSRLAEAWLLTPPEITSFLPDDGAECVPLRRNIEVSFNERVRFGSGIITLMAENGTIVESWNADSDGVIIDGNVLTIDPVGDFQRGAEYRVVIGDGAIEDLAGNAFNDTAEHRFTTTGAEPREVVDCLTETLKEVFFNLLTDDGDGTELSSLAMVDSGEALSDSGAVSEVSLVGVQVV